ncbi:MAG TPA: efflux RND transporter periplasmic adaptor subunit [Vicinamibacterales bacterium]|nr:efflux RND transporter periplasmic adaptor subunit [Vicinamibacterales bacterium]
MTAHKTHSDRRWIWIAAGAPLMAAAGAVGMYLYLRAPSTPAPGPTVPGAAAAASPAANTEVVLTLTSEALSRAGIQTSVVHVGPMTRDIAVPGVVEPNAYRQVTVSAVAAGQVRSVPAELGAHVRSGQTLATIHSPELAEAERVYVSMKADLAAAHQRLVRLESLVKIGAASREELEATQAEHTKHATDVEGARARLLLLGVSPDQVNALVDASRIDPLLTVPAPASGVITQRAINRGQNIEASTELFTIVDLSTVWIVGDVYERDLGRVRLGNRATMTTPALPGQTWKGAVTYIDAQVTAETRTARLRIETSNPGERLRLGMFVDVLLSDAAATNVLMVPRSAVQTIGNQSVVYVADQAQQGRFVERVVGLGRVSGDDVEVIAGLTDGERVVTLGSFFLRAERDRLGLPPPVATAAPPTDRSSETPARVEIAATKEGFVPARVTVAVGVPIDLVFTRRAEATCATEVVVPSMQVKKALPLNTPVVVRLTPTKSGEIAFACGMDMFRGTVVVR